MFRPKALVPVRQKHDQTTLAIPFIFHCRDELVNDDLRAVREVSELGLPNSQAVGILHGIPKFKSQHAIFRKRGVGSCEKAVVVAFDVLQRAKLVVGFLIMKNAVTVREGAALRVLSTNAHVDTLAQQRTKSQTFDRSPVELLCGLQAFSLKVPMKVSIQNKRLANFRKRRNNSSAARTLSFMIRCNCRWSLISDGMSTKVRPMLARTSALTPVSKYSLLVAGPFMPSHFPLSHGLQSIERTGKAKSNVKKKSKIQSRTRLHVETCAGSGSSGAFRTCAG